MEESSRADGMTDMEWLEREQEKEMIELAMERSLSDFQHTQPSVHSRRSLPLQHQPLHETMPVPHQSYSDHYGGRREISNHSGSMNHHQQHLQYPQHRPHERDRISNRRATYNSGRPDVYSSGRYGVGSRENSMRSLAVSERSPVLQRSLTPTDYPRSSNFRETQEVTEAGIENQNSNYDRMGGSANPSALYHDRDRRHSSGPLHHQFDYRQSRMPRTDDYGGRVPDPNLYHEGNQMEHMQHNQMEPMQHRRPNTRTPRHHAPVLETARQHLSEEEANLVEQALNLATRPRRHRSGGRESRQQIHSDTQHSGSSYSGSPRSGRSSNDLSPQEQMQLEEALYASRMEGGPTPHNEDFQYGHTRASAQETMDLLRRASAPEYLSQEELDTIEQALVENDVRMGRSHVDEDDRHYQHDSRPHATQIQDHHHRGFDHRHHHHHEDDPPPLVPIEHRHHQEPPAPPAQQQQQHYDLQHDDPHDVLHQHELPPLHEYPDHHDAQQPQDLPSSRDFQEHHNRQHPQEVTSYPPPREPDRVAQPQGYRPNPRFAATNSLPRRSYSEDSLALAKEEIQKAVQSNTLSREEYAQLMMALEASNISEDDRNAEGNCDTSPTTDADKNGSDEAPMTDNESTEQNRPAFLRSASVDSLSQRHSQHDKRRSTDLLPRRPPSSHNQSEQPKVLSIDDVAATYMCEPFPDAGAAEQSSSDAGGHEEARSVEGEQGEGENNAQLAIALQQEDKPQHDETHEQHEVIDEQEDIQEEQRDEDRSNEKEDVNMPLAEGESSGGDPASALAVTVDGSSQLDHSMSSSSTRGNPRSSDVARPPSHRGIRLGSSHHSQSRQSRRGNPPELSAALAALPYASNRPTAQGAPGSVSIDMEYSLSQFGDSVGTFGSDYAGQQKGEDSTGSFISSDTGNSHQNLGSLASPQTVTSQTVRGVGLLPPPLGELDDEEEEDDEEDDVLKEIVRPQSHSSRPGSDRSSASVSSDEQSKQRLEESMPENPTIALSSSSPRRQLGHEDAANDDGKSATTDDESSDIHSNRRERHEDSEASEAPNQVAGMHLDKLGDLNSQDDHEQDYRPVASEITRSPEPDDTAPSIAGEPPTHEVDDVRKNRETHQQREDRSSTSLGDDVEYEGKGLRSRPSITQIQVNSEPVILHDDALGDSQKEEFRRNRRQLRDWQDLPRERHPQYDSRAFEVHQQSEVENSEKNGENRDDSGRYEVQNRPDKQFHEQPRSGGDGVGQDDGEKYFQDQWAEPHRRGMRNQSDRLDNQRRREDRVLEKTKRGDTRSNQGREREFFRQRQYQSARQLGRGESDHLERYRRHGGASRQRRSEQEVVPDVPEQVRVDPGNLREEWAANGRSNSVSSLGESTQYSIYSAHFRNAEDYDRFRNENNYERALYEHNNWRQSHPTPLPPSVREPNQYGGSDYTGSSRRLQQVQQQQNEQTSNHSGFRGEADFERERNQQSEHDRFDEDLKRALYESIQMQRESQLQHEDEYGQDLQDPPDPQKPHLTREQMDHINRALGGSDQVENELSRHLVEPFGASNAGHIVFPADRYDTVSGSDQMARDLSDQSRIRVTSNIALNPESVDEALERALREAKDEEERQSLLLARQLQQEDERMASRATPQSPVRVGAVGSTSPIRERHPLEAELPQSPSERLPGRSSQRPSLEASLASLQQSRSSFVGAVRSSSPERPRHPLEESYRSSQQRRTNHVGAIRSSSPDQIRHPLEESNAGRTSQVGAVRSSSPERVRHPLENAYSAIPQGSSRQVGAVQSTSPIRARHPLEESYSSHVSPRNQHQCLDDSMQVSSSNRLDGSHTSLHSSQDNQFGISPRRDSTGDLSELDDNEPSLRDIGVSAQQGATAQLSPQPQKSLPNLGSSNPVNPSPPSGRRAREKRDSKVLGSVARLGKMGVTSLMQSIKLGSARKMGSNQNGSGGLPGNIPPPPIQQMDLDTRIQIDRAINRGIINQINGVVKLGREATIFHAEKGPESNGFDVAVKVYKRAQGGGSAPEDNTQRDLSQFQNISSKEQLELWTIKEFRNLKRARRAGVPTPAPLLAKNNILFMQFLGTDGRPSPQLGDMDFRRGHKRWKNLYKQIIEAVRRLFTSALLVHGDLNETNVLVVPRHYIDATMNKRTKDYDADTAVLIDFGQTVDSKHPDAMDLLRRDLVNLRQFFVKQGVRTPSVDDALQFVTSGNASSTEFNKFDEASPNKT